MGEQRIQKAQRGLNARRVGKPTQDAPNGKIRVSQKYKKRQEKVKELEEEFKKVGRVGSGKLECWKTKCPGLKDDEKNEKLRNLYEKRIPMCFKDQDEFNAMNAAIEGAAHC